MSPGITLQSISKGSLLAEYEEHFDNAYLHANGATTATSQLVASTDLSSGYTSEAALTLTALATGRLPLPCYVHIKTSDAAADDLAGTVKVTGYRFGVLQEETITIAAGTDDVDGTLIFDEITAMTANMGATGAASDTLIAYPSTVGFGLRFPIKEATDVKLICMTGHSAGAQEKTAVSTSTVDVATAGIKPTTGLVFGTPATYKVVYRPHGWADRARLIGSRA